jgi:hypothetical protein
MILLYYLYIQMQTNNLYDYKSFNIDTETTDYDVRTNQTDLWSNIDTAWMCRLTFNKAITLKVNLDTMPWISLATTDSWCTLGNGTDFTFPVAYISNLFISNASGDTVTVWVYLWSPQLVN